MTSSSTSPMRPCQAAPALETTMSTPPKAAATASNAARTEGAAGAGDGGDLACERRVLACAELGLFERPIFTIEHVGFGDRLEAADRLGVAHALDPGFGDVGCDFGIALGA